MFDTKHYQTGEFNSRAVFLPDKEYALLLDNIVKACTDCLITRANGDVFVAKRKAEPQSDWYNQGGLLVVE